MPMRSKHVVGVVASLFAAVGLWFWLARRPAGRLQTAVRDRGDLVVLGNLAGVSAIGTRLVPVCAQPTISRALSKTRLEDLHEALAQAQIQGILAARKRSAQGVSLGARMMRSETIAQTQLIYLDEVASFYTVLDELVDYAVYGEVLSTIARRLLNGKPVPGEQELPLGLRVRQPVEVMVMLREGGRARLWRSARGNSIYTALQTACRVAKKRWIARASSMGRALEVALPELDVELWLLRKDGELGDYRPAFLDQVLDKEHGIGYDKKGAWNYLLPSTVLGSQAAAGHQAYVQLFKDFDLSSSDLERADFKLYRLVAVRLGTSTAPVP